MCHTTGHQLWLAFCLCPLTGLPAALELKLWPAPWLFLALPLSLAVMFSSLPQPGRSLTSVPFVDLDVLICHLLHTQPQVLPPAHKIPTTSLGETPPQFPGERGLGHLSPHPPLSRTMALPEPEQEPQPCLSFSWVPSLDEEIMALPARGHT